MRYHMITDLRTGETKVEEIPDDAPSDPKELMQQLIHDCPECRALRAQGETPVIVDAEAIRGTRSVFRRRPRWRDLKRTARR